MRVGRDERAAEERRGARESHGEEVTEPVRQAKEQRSVARPAEVTLVETLRMTRRLDTKSTWH